MLVLGVLLGMAIWIISTVVGLILAAGALAMTKGSLDVLIPNPAARTFIIIVWAAVYLYLGISAFTVRGAGMNFIYALLVFWIPAIALWIIAGKSH